MEIIEQGLLDAASLQCFAFIRRQIPDIKQATQILNQSLEALVEQKDIKHFPSVQSLSIYLRIIARGLVRIYLNKEKCLK